MTWGEWKLRVLQKIFSNEGAALNVDDNNQDYVNAMPGAYNEAVHILITRGKPQFGRIVLEGREDVQEPTVTETGLLLPIRQNYLHIDLAAYRDDVIRVREDAVETVSGSVVDVYASGQTELAILARWPYMLRVDYERQPEKVTAQTPDDTELDVTDEIAVPSVLYAASELYKEDDIQLSTQWRNQFETEIENLQSRRRPMQRSVEKTSGWWLSLIHI